MKKSLFLLVAVLTLLTAVFLLNGCGRGGSNSNSAQDSASAIRPPDAPTDVVAVAGDSQATITFSAPASVGSSAIANYTVTASPGNIITTGPTSPITVTGLSNGVIYSFTVKAASATGTSPSSANSNSVMPLNSTTSKWLPDGDVTCAATDGINQYLAIEKDDKIFIAKYENGHIIWELPFIVGKNYYANRVLAPTSNDSLVLIATNGASGKESDGPISIVKIRKSDGVLLSAKSILDSTRFLDVKILQGASTFRLLFDKTANKTTYITEMDLDANVIYEMQIPYYWEYDLLFIEASDNNVFAGGIAMGTAVTRLNILMLNRDLTNPLVSQQRPFNASLTASDQMTDFITTPAGEMFVAGQIQAEDGTYNTSLFKIAPDTGDYTQVAQINGNSRLTNLATDSASNIYGILRGVNTNELYKFNGTAFIKLATIDPADVTDLMIDGTNIFVMYRSVPGYQALSYPNVRLSVFNASTGARIN